MRSGWTTRVLEEQATGGKYLKSDFSFLVETECLVLELVCAAGTRAQEQLNMFNCIYNLSIFIFYFWNVEKKSKPRTRVSLWLDLFSLRAEKPNQWNKTKETTNEFTTNTINNFDKLNKKEKNNQIVENECS